MFYSAKRLKKGKMFDYSPEHCSHDGVKNLNRIIAFVVDVDVCLID